MWINWLVVLTGYWLPISLFTFFLKVLNQQCHIFSKGYFSNFSTDLSSQIFDCYPRNFVIQEEGFGNVVSTSHWITPVSESLLQYSQRRWYCITLESLDWLSMCYEFKARQTTFLFVWYYQKFLLEFQTKQMNAFSMNWPGTGLWYYYKWM